MYKAEAKKSKQLVRRMGFTLSLKYADFYGETIAMSITPGQYLHCLRTLSGLSREEVAKMLNIHKCTLANWETDRIPVTQDNLERVRKSLMEVGNAKLQ